MSVNKLDILVFAAHPDDAELGCSGTIASHVAQGYKVGVIDLTQGEMGTRGTPEIRLQEADRSAKILGLDVRENLNLPDIFFQNNEETQLILIQIIRKYQPEIVLTNAIRDRHPDHGKASSLTSTACFMSGLRKIDTELEGVKQAAWRPRQVYHYIQNDYIEPDVVVDISPYWDQKIQSIRAFQSQFYDPSNQEPISFISDPDFLPFVESRAREMGHKIGKTHGEGFTVERKLGVTDLFDLH